MIYHLSSSGIINEKSGSACSYFRSSMNVCHKHDHDFFELVITVSDNVIHEVCGKRIALKKGSLILIRPHDTHRYVDEGQGEFSYINLAFTVDTYKIIAECLGAEKQMNELASAKMPPVVVLSNVQAVSLINQFMNLMGEATVPEPLIYSRGVITSVISKYFLNGFVQGFDNKLPDWLVLLCNEIHKIENFSAGVDCMRRLANKSYGYIGQCFQKYLGTTPTEYINKIRLEYAANMLLCTNFPIIDVCMECGFENLGHFYKMFKAKYGMSPGKYRRTLQVEVII